MGENRGSYQDLIGGGEGMGGLEGRILGGAVDGVFCVLDESRVGPTINRRCLGIGFDTKFGGRWGYKLVMRW